MTKLAWGSLLAAVLWSTPGLATAKDRLEGQMTILGITLEKTTLRGAQRVLGHAGIRDNGGDAGAHAKAECYEGRDGTVLALASSGEMGGGTVITSYQLVERGALAVYSDDPRYTVPEDRRPECAALLKLSKGTTTAGGLRLGMTEADVRRVLGSSSNPGEGFLEFTSSVSVRTAHGDATRGRTIRVEFADGRAEAIRAWQVTST